MVLGLPKEPSGHVMTILTFDCPLIHAERAFFARSDTDIQVGIDVIVTPTDCNEVKITLFE